jgi:hypothetical protein
MSDLEIQDQSSNHHYRTELPNILFELGLKANEFSLYCAFKRSAGDSGYCTKSAKTLCKEAGVGERCFVKLKRSLSKKNKILGKSLISVKKRMKSGAHDTDFVTINDIWPENYKFFIDKKEGGTAKMQVPAKMHQVPQKCREGTAKMQDKEEQLKKNHIKKTTTTNKEKSPSSFSNEISQEEKDAAKKAFDFILLRSKSDSDEKWNIDLKTLEKYFHVYGIEYTTEQFNYLLDRMNKYRLNKSKPGNKITEIDDPKVYFKKACSENYAKSLHLNELNNKIKKIE